jgi:hypothetical protein
MSKEYVNNPGNIARQVDKTKDKYTKALAKTQGKVQIDGDRRKGSKNPEKN